jgi:hypothetical protein
MDDVNRPIYKSKLFIIFTGLLSAIFLSSITLVMLVASVLSPEFKPKATATEEKSAEVLDFLPTPTPAPDPDLPRMSVPTITPEPENSTILELELPVSPTPTSIPYSYISDPNSQNPCSDAVAQCMDNSCSYSKWVKYACIDNGGIRVLFPLINIEQFYF